MGENLRMRRAKYRIKLKDLAEMIYESTGKRYSLTQISLALNDRRTWLDCIIELQKAIDSVLPR